MPSGDDDVDRLLDAIDAHERFVAEHGQRSTNEFLAAHEHLRDLLEPLLAPSRTASQPLPASAQVFGDFRLLGELGRGGMGIVYDAEQISLGRRVAVKVLPSRLAWDPDRRARFARESRLAASLDHPSIAKVLSAGIDDDLIWFAMERIDGAPLDRVLSWTAATDVGAMTGDKLASAVDDVARKHGAGVARPRAATDRSESTVWRSGHVETVMRIGMQIAAALHHAHQHGVVHRDVKPANILLRRDGSAVLTDFGLARELGAPSLTLTGEFLGTPAYSAPEQLAGERAMVDHRADVFALGVTMYELLTHRRPFEASTTDEVRVRILTVEPPTPRRLNPRIPRGLSAVLLKALEKDPNRRYQTAAAMADDLRAVADGRPVRARPIRAHTRTWRWCRRNPWVATALAMLVGVVLLWLVLALRAQLVRANVGQTIHAALALARADNFPGALAMFMPLEREFPGATTRAGLDELFRRCPCLSSQLLVADAEERVVTASFSSDGQRLLTTHERQPNGRPRSWHVRLWVVPAPEAPIARQLWRSVECAGRPVAGHVDPEPAVVWAIRGERTVFIDGPDRDSARIPLAAPILDLLPASVPGRFGVWFETRVQRCDLAGRVDREWIHPYDLDRRPTILADVLVWTQSIASRSRLVYATPGAEPVEILSTTASTNDRPACHPDPDDPARIEIATSTSITAWRWDGDQMRRVDSVDNPLPSPEKLGVLGGDGIALTATHPHLARLGELPLRMDLLTSRVFGAGAGRSREPYLLAIDERVLRIWGMPDPQHIDSGARGLEIARFEPTAQIGLTARRLWYAGEEALAAQSFDAYGPAARVDVKLPPDVGDAVAGQLRPSFCAITFDPGRAILACARGVRDPRHPPGWIFVLTADGLRESADSYVCSAEPTWIELSPDYRQLAVALSNGDVELWAYDSQTRKLTAGAVVPRSADDATRLSCARYLGNRFLLASEGRYRGRGGILRWDLDHLDAPPVAVAPAGISQPLRCLAVSRDRELVATGGTDGRVRVMRVVWHEGEPTLAAAWDEDHHAEVFAVAFAERDGAVLMASADRRGGIRLWDAATGEPMGVVRDPAEGREEMTLSLDFSPDYRYLAAAQHGGRVLVWDMDRPRRCFEGNRDCAEQSLRLQTETR